MKFFQHWLVMCLLILSACKKPLSAGIVGKYVSNIGNQTITITAATDGKYKLVLVGDKNAEYSGATLQGEKLNWSDGTWPGYMLFDGAVARSSIDRWATYKKVE